MKETKLQKYAAISLVLMPVFACYNLFGTCVAKYMMLLSCVVFFVFGKNRIFYPRFFLAFLIYSFTIPQIIAYSTGHTSQFLGSYITLGIFAFNLCLMIPHLKVGLVVKYYRVLIYFTMVIFALQEISALTTGHRFCALIPFMTLYTDVPVSHFAPLAQYATRSSSIFVEPSHYAQYLAPYLALTLCGVSNKKRFVTIDAILVSVVFLIMRSGVGLILAVVIWSIHVLFADIKLSRKLFFIVPLSAFLAFQIYSVFSQSEQGAAVLDRQEEMSIDYERINSSGTVRIYRGFFVLEDTPFLVKMFGVGQGGANDVIDHSTVKWMFNNEHYLNNTSGFILSYGYIGTLIFLLFLLFLYNKNNKDSLMLIVGFIVLCFLEDFMCDSRMLLYIGIICLIKYSDKMDLLLLNKKK